jgi:integrase
MDEGRSSAGRYHLIKGTLHRYLLPFFGKRDITMIKKKDLDDYRAWRQAYWITGDGSRKEKIYHKVTPASGTLKQEWTVLRGVFLYGVELGLVSPMSMPMLRHEEYTIGRRPAFTLQEYRDLYKFMRKWVRTSPTQHVRAERELIRNYILIMINCGLRKGEARNLKWRDLRIFENEHGRWPLLHVQSGKTGERLTVCQPLSRIYFDRLRARGHHTGPDDFIFCHEDGKPVQHFKSFGALLTAAGLLKDSAGRVRTIYSLRHTYATFRLENGTSIYWLKDNMGTSVQMIERHYGQTKILSGIQHETIRRRKYPTPPSISAEEKKKKEEQKNLEAESREGIEQAIDPSQERSDGSHTSKQE